MTTRIMDRELPDGVTFAQRYGRIVDACDKARIGVLCRAHEWATGETAQNMEQTIHERLWTLWKDEWDQSDWPYGGEGDDSAWTVPKFCHNVASKVIKETERDNRLKGVTQSPHGTEADTRSAFRVASADLNDLDLLYRPDGTQAFIVLLLPDTDRTRQLIELHIAGQIDPEGDPASVYAGAERAARAIWRQLNAKTGNVNAARLLNRIEQGRDKALADQLRGILFSVYYGDQDGLHALTESLGGKPAAAGRTRRRHTGNGTRQCRKTATK